MKEKEVTDYVNTIAASQKMRFGTMIGRGLDRVSWNAPTQTKLLMYGGCWMMAV